MNILITGGNGYIARNLYSFLNQKYNTTRVTRIDFDLTDTWSTFSWFIDKKFDVVIHTAVVGGSRLQIDKNDTVLQNVKMIHNLQMNKHSFDKLITFGSGAELFAPDVPYGISKKAISEIVNNIDNWFNLRIFGLFNEDELETRFIKGNILRYLRKEPMIIHTNKIMDFYYMDDLISLVDNYITKINLPKNINCSYESKFTLKDIANYINNLDDYKVPIIVENKKDLEFYCGNSHDIEYNEIGLLSGIQHTYRKLKQGLILNDSSEYF